MFDLSPAAVGLLLISLGIALTLLTLGILRLLPRLQPAQEAPPPPASPLVAAHHEAVVLVQSGGRVVYMNPAARELFNVWEDEPNLEGLARRARPSQSFLLLCAGEGQARFSLNGQFVEGSSYLHAREHRERTGIHQRHPGLTAEPPGRCQPDGWGRTRCRGQRISNPGHHRRPGSTRTPGTGRGIS